MSNSSTSHRARLTHKRSATILGLFPTRSDSLLDADDSEQDDDFTKTPNRHHGLSSSRMPSNDRPPDSLSTGAGNSYRHRSYLDRSAATRSRHSEEHDRSFRRDSAIDSSTTSLNRGRASSLLSQLATSGGIGGPATSVGLRGSSGMSLRHGLPSPPNTGSDGGSGVGSTSGTGSLRRSLGLAGKRGEGALTPESGRGAKSLGGRSSDAGSRGSLSGRRPPYAPQTSSGGVNSFRDADSQSQGSGSNTSRASPRHTSRAMRTNSKSSSSSHSVPTSPSVRSPLHRSSIDLSPTKTIAQTTCADSLSHSGSGDLSSSVRSSATLRAEAATGPGGEKMEKTDSGESVEGLGKGKVRARDKTKAVFRDEERPVMVGRSKRLVSMKEKNERFLASVNAHLSPPASPARDPDAPGFRDPDQQGGALSGVTPGPRPSGPRTDTMRSTSSFASENSSGGEGALPFAKGTSPAPRKIGKAEGGAGAKQDNTGSIRRRSTISNDESDWMGSVKRLAKPSRQVTDLEAFAGDENQVGDGKGSVRRVTTPLVTKTNGAESERDSAMRRTASWASASSKDESQTSSGSFKGHRRNWSDSMASSSNETARAKLPNEGDDHEATPGKRGLRSFSVSSVDSHGLRSSRSVDEFGSAGGSNYGTGRFSSATAGAAPGRREREGTWSSGRRSSDRSLTSMSQYPSTISHSRSATSRPSSRATSAFGDARSFSTNRRRRSGSLAKDDSPPPVPVLTSSMVRRVRPGLPTDFVESAKEVNPGLRTPQSDARSSGGKSGGPTPFPQSSESAVPSTANSDNRSRLAESESSRRLPSPRRNRTSSIFKSPAVEEERKTSLLASPRSAGSAARSRHMSLTDDMIKPRALDGFKRMHDRTHTRSSLSPTTLAFERQALNGQLLSRSRSSALPGDDDWWDEVEEIRSRAQEMLSQRPDSRMSGRGSGGNRSLSRADSRATPGQRAERERERTLRGGQTGPSAARATNPEAASDFSAGARSRPGTANHRDRRSTLMEEILPRTPLSAVMTRLQSRSGTRPESARSGPFSPTPESEVHRLLLNAFEALERFHHGQIDEETPSSVDMVSKMAALVRATCRINAGLRQLAGVTMEAQVDLQVDETRSASSISVLVELERLAGQLLRQSEEQVRDLTEGLLAMPRAERERDRLRQSGTLFRSASRAGYTSRSNSPEKVLSPRAFTHQYPLHDAAGDDEAESSIMTHRRGMSTMSHIARNPRTSILSPTTRGPPKSAAAARPVTADVHRPALRPSKSSSISTQSTATTNTIKPPPSPFPRSPAVRGASPQLSQTNAEADASPTQRRPYPNGRERRISDGGALDPISSNGSEEGARSSRASHRHSMDPGAFAALESPNASPQRPRRKLSNAAAALERIVPFPGRRSKRSTGPGSVGDAAAAAAASAAGGAPRWPESPGHRRRSESRDASPEAEAQAQRRMDRQDKVKEVLSRRSSQRYRR